MWGIFLGIAVLLWYGKDLPDVNQVTDAKKRPEVLLLAADGSILARYGDLQAERVDVSEMPAYLPEAVISIEDRRFYSHFGVDPLGILRAFYRNIKAGRLVQGGSTITQQLAKNMFLSSERTFKRKIQEAMLSVWLETKFTKDEILTAYLNRVYLGAGTYGVEAAAQTYFGHSVRQVSLEEAATLAGLLKAPSSLAPSRHPAKAEARAQVVLNAMVDAGYLTQAARDRVQTKALSAPVPKKKPGAAGNGLYYADWIYNQISNYIGDEETDLVVYTMYQPKYQRIAETKLATLIDTQGPKYNFSQGAFVLMQPNGAVEALVGGANYNLSQYNRATQARRQPGSAFKPIIYLAGLEAGLYPSDVFEDAPTEIKGYAPKNYGNKYLGPITMIEGLIHSSNSVSLQVLDYAGIDRAIELAKMMGITSPLRRDLTLALGGSEVSLLELTTAYASLDQGGERAVPWGIRKIVRRNGDILYEHQGQSYGFISPPKFVLELNAMMEQVVQDGTGKHAQLPGRDVAGKTGTSQNYKDAWFLGFTGNYVGGVWLGNDEAKTMDYVTGGGLPARLWHDIMQEVHVGLPVQPIPTRDIREDLRPQNEEVAAPKTPKKEKGFWSSFFGSGDVKYTYPSKN